jgi:hypothetical protein
MQLGNIETAFFVAPFLDYSTVMAQEMSPSVPIKK